MKVSVPFILTGYTDTSLRGLVVFSWVMFALQSGRNRVKPRHYWMVAHIHGIVEKASFTFGRH